MIAFARITGIMLMLVFGSQYVFLQLRTARLDYESRVLQQKKIYGFARVTRTQELNKLSPLVSPRYYLSVKGTYLNYTFYKSERVPPSLYYLYSVGSNIEVAIAILDVGRPLVHIRKNPFPYEKTPGLLLDISFWSFIIGSVFVLFGFFIGPTLGKILPIPAWKRPSRPSLS